MQIVPQSFALVESYLFESEREIIPLTTDFFTLEDGDKVLALFGVMPSAYISNVLYLWMKPLVETASVKELRAGRRAFEDWCDPSWCWKAETLRQDICGQKFLAFLGFKKVGTQLGRFIYERAV